MKINGSSDIKSNAVVRRKKTASSGEVFSIADGSTESESAHGAAQAGPVAALNALLSLQEVTDRDEEPLERGHKTLDLLDEIRHGLLTGAVPVTKLRLLTQIIDSERSTVSDPGLAAVLDEIDLRAQVELAKYEIGDR